MLPDNHLEITLDQIKDLQYMLDTLDDKIYESELNVNIYWQRKILESRLSDHITNCLWPIDEIISVLQKEVDRRKHMKEPHYMTRYQTKKKILNNIYTKIKNLQCRK